MGGLLDTPNETNTNTQIVLSPAKENSTVNKKVLEAQKKLYNEYMEVMQDPTTIDPEYDGYKKMASKVKEYIPKKKYKKTNSGMPFKKPRTRKLKIKLEELYEEMKESDKVNPLLIQSTDQGLLKEARAFREMKGRENNLFNSIGNPSSKRRPSLALRQQEFSKKSAIVDKLSLLPPEIFMNILTFLIDRFRDYLCVNPSWYSAIVTAFDREFNGIENNFVRTYSECLLFKDSYTSSSYIHCADAKGIRIDRVLRCENLALTLGRTCVIEYLYSYVGRKEVYRAVYKFDSVKRSNKIVWVYRNDCFFNGLQGQGRAATQGIAPIVVGDNIEFAVNYFNIKGLVDINSIKWLPPVLENTPLENLLTYKGREKREKEKHTEVKVFADLSRICELEDSEMEWRDFLYDSQPKSIFPFKMLTRCFKIEDLEYSNIDKYVLKVKLRATVKGRNDPDIFGIGVKVVDAKHDECTNEVKKLGLAIERYADVEVRVGDLLVFYYSKTVEEDDP
eukprot:TRINITY_DN2198_c0_g2_i1.p1 TRINITY_DN2198_c0_g2~~TRINITY_DN2198_c0_g2_i1.p1  ORF type:complete len:505 (-),score=127.95 TRINITY_DN2198_c0_g2_i1:153-1667(-)